MNFLKSFWILATRNLMTWKGRATRSEYLIKKIIMFLIYVCSIAIFFVSDEIGIKDGILAYMLIGVFFALILLQCWVGFLVSIRRLHDAGFSGWWFLAVSVIVLLIAASLDGWGMPVSYILSFLIYYSLSSTKGENRFGPVPVTMPAKAVAVADDAQPQIQPQTAEVE